MTETLTSPFPPISLDLEEILFGSVEENSGTTPNMAFPSHPPSGTTTTTTIAPSSTLLPPELSSLLTESPNPFTAHISSTSPTNTLDLCRIINGQDAFVAMAVSRVVPLIARVVDAVVGRVKNGGRVFYMGAGSSGRLGVADAAEQTTTFNANPMQFIALIAGGDTAIRTPLVRQSIEDSREAGIADLQSLIPTAQDTLVAISASGRTPYTLGALQSAKKVQGGMLTVGLVCNTPSSMSVEGNCDFIVEAITGPEVIAGCTRLKAGSAIKMILNMISTALHIKLGNTYRNLMVSLALPPNSSSLSPPPTTTPNPSQPTPTPTLATTTTTTHPSPSLTPPPTPTTKHLTRARSIIRTIASSFPPGLPPTYTSILTSNTDLDHVLLTRCGGDLKLALVVITSGWGVDLCRDALERRGGELESVLEDVRYETVVRVFNR